MADSSSSKKENRRLVAGLVSPAGASRMEAESRTWRVRCGKCGFERSVWETGGVIYKGAGTRYWYRTCPNCGKRSWHKVYWPAGVKKSDVYAAAIASSPALSNKAPWMLWVGLAVLWAGAIVLFVLGLLWLLNALF